MTKRKKDALGKGIRALLQDIEKENKAEKAFPEIEEQATPSVQGVSSILLDEIEVNPFQPRANFEDEALRELAESIEIHGVIQPISVRRLKNGNYQLIAGERRTRASRLAGLERIPAYIREANDQEMLEIALIENIQREDLNALEIAMNYERLLNECALTQEQLAKRVGKSRSNITNFIRLLNLAPTVQRAVRHNLISMGHARALLGLEDFDEQEKYCSKIVENGLSVRDTERLIKQLKENKDKKKGSTKKEPSAAWIEFKSIVSKLTGAKANIRSKGKGKGEIVIPFSNDDELHSIIERLDQ